MDLLRGVVMAFMALDHFRNGFSNAFAVSPTDLSQAGAALFLTRWITHFCAPVFVLLAGTGAFLALVRGKTRQQLAWFLLTRGLGLLVLELAVTGHLGYWSFDLHEYPAGVVWAIGWSMVAMAGLVFLPTGAVALFGLSMIAAHNLFDGVRPEELGALGGLWNVLHGGGYVDLAAGTRLVVYYPLIPWIGVMAAGYGLGLLLQREPEARKKWLVGIGAASTLLFVLLRAVNAYGDPSPWSAQTSGLLTFLSFLNCTKYPASLLFLLMTLGPAIALFPVWEKGLGRVGRYLLIYGRVPLFFFVVHLALLHLSVWVHGFARYGGQMTQVFAAGLPLGYGYSLPVVYAIWLAALVALYPVCRWYAGVKQRSRSRWLSYL